MQQKVQFVTTILHQPKLLIFDEPFSGFDPINANLLKQEILELKKQGSTIIFSTHDMGSVEELCDNITLINKSRTILEGNVHDIKMGHRSNLFEIGFEGDASGVIDHLGGHFTLVEHQHEKNMHRIRIKAAETSTGNDLLKTVMPLTSITSFNEVIPTMNEIFIRVVKAQNLILNPEAHE